MTTGIFNFLRRFSATLRVTDQSTLIRQYTKDNIYYLYESKPSLLQKSIFKWIIKFDAKRRKKELNMTETGDSGGILDPPETVRGMKVLDRSLFRKTVSIPALIVPGKNIGKLAKSMKKEILHFRSIKPIAELNAQDSLSKSHKLVLFNPVKIKTADDFNEVQRNLLKDFNVELTSFHFYNLDMNYENWNHAEIIKAVLPRELEAVSGFATVGHIAHINLRDGTEDFKHLIGY